MAEISFKIKSIIFFKFILCWRIKGSLVFVLSRVWLTMDGFWIYNWFIEHLRIVNPSKYSAFANSQILHFTTSCTVFQACCIFANFLVTASMADVPFPMGSRTLPVPQLPVSIRDSQGLNLSNLSLTHQPTHSTPLTLTNCPAHNITTRTAQKTHSFVAVQLLFCGPRRKHNSSVVGRGPLPNNGRCTVVYLEVTT
jgi:hypothetical protein